MFNIQLADCLNFTFNRREVIVQQYLVITCLQGLAKIKACRITLVKTRFFELTGRVFELHYYMLCMFVIQVNKHVVDDFY